MSVCIVNWNGMNYLPNCLRSIYAQDYQGNIEIIIVDNFSTDNSREYIEKTCKDMVLLKNGSNKGFAYAHNQGIRLSKGEYILLLNFDVFLEYDFITQMVKVMERDLKIGMVAGKLYKLINGRKSNLIDSTGIIMNECFMRPRGEMEEDHGQYDGPENVEIFGVCGAAAFYRREMIEDIKCFDEFFDEDFVNYVEDVDLSWRAGLRGWKCIYNYRAIAYHERGATRKDNSKMQREYFIYGLRNRYWSMIKNITSAYWKNNKYKIINRELLFMFSPLKEVSLSVKIKALYLSLKLFPKMIIKRKFIQEKKLLDESMDKFINHSNLNLTYLSRALIPLKIREIAAKLVFRIR